jgi:AcrR family transcriptional regulator
MPGEEQRPAAGAGAAGGAGAPAGAVAGECERGQPGGPPARERILEAAERLFAERGFDRTSTARIAAAAGVPHGLIFYHFKTKMDLLLAVVRDSEVVMMDDLAALPRDRADLDRADLDRADLDRADLDRADLRQAVAEIWRQLSAALGKPSPVRRIIFSELAVHPEVRQRALALQDQISAIVSGHLARASGHGAPLPEHETAARLLTTSAGMAPLLEEPGDTRMDPGTVAALIADGIRRAGS